MQVLEIIPHDSGPWLVKAGGVMYSVPPGLGQALRPFSGQNPEGREISVLLADAKSGSAQDIDALAGELAHALASEFPRSKGRPIRMRVPLVPARTVKFVSGKISFLTGNRALGILTGLGIAGYLTGTAGSGRVGFSWDLGAAAAGLGLFLLSAIWHEMGHAAALARSGYPPGGIGAGVLVVIPVLFADVTAVGVLPRTGRFRVDLSGVVFQLAAGGLCMALAAWWGHSFWTPVLAFTAGSVLFAVSWSLFPFIRSDGYWLLCDLLGLDDLDRPPPEPVSRPMRIFLVLFQAANAVFLVFIGIFFPARMIGLALDLIPHFGYRLDANTARWLSWGLAFVFLGAMGIGIFRRVKILVRSAWRIACGCQSYTAE